MNGIAAAMPPARGWNRGLATLGLTQTTRWARRWQPLHLTADQGGIVALPAVGHDDDDGAPHQSAPTVLVVELLQGSTDPGAARPVGGGQCRSAESEVGVRAAQGRG